MTKRSSTGGRHILPAILILPGFLAVPAHANGNQAVNAITVAR